MNTQTLAPFALTAEQVAIINARPEAPDTVPLGARALVCFRCRTVTYNEPVVADVLCDRCTWGAVRAFAAEAAERNTANAHAIAVADLVAAIKGGDTHTIEQAGANAQAAELAAWSARQAASDAAEHARIRAERDAEMSALIKAEAARRGLPPGRFTYMSC